MDPKLYTAAMKNDLEVLKRYGADQFALQVTQNSNTVLHVAALFGSAESAEYILSKCPSLFRRVNTDGNTPIHVAVARNNYGVLGSLVDFACFEGGGAMSARNHDGDTPLHLAASSNYIERDEFLDLLLAEEDLGFDHGPNRAGETPVYLYVKQGYYLTTGILRQLLGTCTLLEHGVSKGGTALHAVVGNYFGGLSPWSMRRSDEFVDVLIGWKKELIKEPDTYGRTPLHYAAQNGYVEAVKKLLDNDETVAYVTRDNGNTALHIAAAFGRTKVMELILSKCPDCWEIVNRKRQNILHLSADMDRSDEATKYISKQKWAIDLLNGKDHEGNTPMHVLAHKGKEKLFFRLARGGGDELFALNNEGKAPFDILLPKNWLQRKRFLRRFDKTTQETRNGGPGAGEGVRGTGPDQIDLATFLRNTEEHKAAEDVSKMMTDTHMIVATLISTMSFTAGFTIPGGYHQEKGRDEGTAVLVREAAFKAFVIANTLAVVCSTSSVFLYVSASLFNTSGPEGEKRARRHAIAFGLIITAMLAMMVAFSTGAYAVLSHSLGLAIVTCVIACSSSIVYAVELKKHFREEIAQYSREEVLGFLSEIMDSVRDGCVKCIGNLVHRVRDIMESVRR